MVSIRERAREDSLTSEKPWRYFHSGLTIASGIEFPEWSPCEQAPAGGAADVTILSDCEPARIGQETGSQAACRFQVPGLGAVEVRGGREIQLRPLAGLDPSRLRPWVTGPAWAAACYQRGLFLLHASAVQIGDGAALFCGPPGRGKSTLAAQLVKRGYPLVGDDLCRVDFGAGRPPLIHASAPQLKLRQDVIGALGWDTRKMIPDAVRKEKYHVLLSPVGDIKPLPVNVAYILGWGDFEVRKMHGFKGLHDFLVAATYRRRILESMDRTAWHFEQGAEFVRWVSLAQLNRPPDLSASEKTLSFLLG